MTSTSSSQSLLSPSASPTDLWATLMQDEPLAQDGEGGRVAGQRSSPQDCLLANVPTASSAHNLTSLQVHGPDIGRTNNLDQALDNLRKVHADIMELARSMGATQGLPTSPSSSESSEESSATDDEMDANADGVDRLAELNAAGLRPDAVAVLVEKEMDLLEACWRRLMSSDSPFSFVDESNHLHEARRELDQQIQAAQKEARTGRDHELDAWLASSGANPVELQDPIWDGSQIKPPVDEVHGSFLDGSRNISNLSASHEKLMTYVRVRLRLLLNFVAELTQYTKSAANIRNAELSDKNVQVTLQEFQSIVKDLPADISQLEGIKQTRIGVAKLGKHIDGSNHRFWFSLERPDLYRNRYPGLSNFKEALIVACSNAPSDIVSFDKFSLLFARVAHEEKTDSQTLAFLGRGFKALRSYMMLATRGDIFTIDEAGGANEMEYDEVRPADLDPMVVVPRPKFANNMLGAVELERAINTNADKIRKLIDESTKLGFPVH